MFLTAKAIDIFHTQTIDISTLEEGMGGCQTQGVSVHPIHSYAPICMPPCAPTYIFMFLGVSAYDMGMGGIHTPCVECLDDDMLRVKYLEIVLSYWHAFLSNVFLDYNG